MRNGPHTWRVLTGYLTFAFVLAGLGVVKIVEMAIELWAPQ